MVLDFGAKNNDFTVWASVLVLIVSRDNYLMSSGSSHSPFRDSESFLKQPTARRQPHNNKHRFS